MQSKGTDWLCGDVTLVLSLSLSLSLSFSLSELNGVLGPLIDRPLCVKTVSGVNVLSNARAVAMVRRAIRVR